MAKAWPSGNQAGAKFDERDQTPEEGVRYRWGYPVDSTKLLTLMINEGLPEAELCRV